MRFISARKLVGFFLGMAIMAIVTGVAAYMKGTTDLTFYVVGAFGSLLLCIAVILKWCRCPWCNKLIFNRLFYTSECPSCRRNLQTGKKRKGKGGRR